MEKMDFLDFYKDIKVSGENVAGLVREMSRNAFSEIRNQSILEGFKAGYEAAADDLRWKLNGIDLTAGLPEINLEDLKDYVSNNFNEIREYMAENAKFDLSSLQENALAGMHGLEDFVDSAEAGVRAKMAELKEIELSKRDKKIAVMVGVAIITLIVSAAVLSKRYNKKKLIRQAAGKAREGYEGKEDKKESQEGKESDSGSCVCEEVSEAPEKVEEGADCVESGETAGEADTEGAEAPGEE